MDVVAAALLVDGQVLAARRVAPAGWEFPGGKIEPGETPQAALVRECQEELGIEVTCDAHLDTVSDETITLQLWQVALQRGRPAASGDHDELRWVAAEQLAELGWLPLDRALLPAVRNALGAAPACHDPVMRFRSIVELGGKTATGIPIPDDVIDALGSGKRPAVTVTVNGHSYRTTAVRMGDRFFVPLSAENRTAARVAAGDEIEVDIEADQAPREVQLPPDLDSALDAEARAAYDALSYTHRKEWVRWIEDAKKPETRAARVEKTVAGLRAGKKTH